jgi:hypothetical protein
LIKKANKNLIELKPEFFQLFADNIPNNNIINLNENDIAIEKDREIIINSLENELNHVNNLIHYIDEKLLLYENNNNLKIKNEISINTPEKKLVKNNKKNKNKLFLVINYEKKIKGNNAKIKNKENTVPNANKGELMEIKTINNSGKEKMKEIIQNTAEEQKEFIFKGEENLPFTINEYTEFFQDKNEIIFNGKRKDSLFSN